MLVADLEVTVNDTVLVAVQHSLHHLLNAATAMPAQQNITSPEFDKRTQRERERERERESEREKKLE